MSQVINQQIWKIWSNFMCPLGPFSLAQSHMHTNIIPFYTIRIIDVVKYTDPHKYISIHAYRYTSCSSTHCYNC